MDDRSQHTDSGEAPHGASRNSAFGFLTQALNVVGTILILLMVAAVVALGLVAVGAVLFGIVLAAAKVLDWITGLWRRVKHSNLMLRLRARGKSAEGRRPIYGRSARPSTGS